MLLAGFTPIRNKQQTARPDLSVIARAGGLRECLGQARYVAAARRPGKRRLWVSRELRPLGSSAYRLSFGLRQGSAARFSDLHGKESLTKANGKLGSCLTLALMALTTIEGLANGDELHPVQAAFIERDRISMRLLYTGTDHVRRRVYQRRQEEIFCSAPVAAISGIRTRPATNAILAAGVQPWTAKTACTRFSVRVRPVSRLIRVTWPWPGGS
jgi:hypothetical protein